MVNARLGYRFLIATESWAVTLNASGLHDCEVTDADDFRTTVDPRPRSGHARRCSTRSSRTDSQRPTAMRFVQVYAIDRVLALVRLDPATALDHPDHFEATRRIERARLPAGLPLHWMMPGYTRNLDAARAVLAWLTAHYETDPVIVTAISELIATLATQTAEGYATALLRQVTHATT